MLGTVNALALTVNSAVRAVMPIAATSVFYAGIKWGWADGHLIWFVLVAFSLALVVVCRFIPEKAAGEVRSGRRDGEEGDEEQDDGRA